MNFLENFQLLSLNLPTYVNTLVPDAFAGFVERTCPRAESFLK